MYSQGEIRMREKVGENEVKRHQRPEMKDGINVWEYVGQTGR